MVWRPPVSVYSLARRSNNGGSGESSDEEATAGGQNKAGKAKLHHSKGHNNIHSTHTAHSNAHNSDHTGNSNTHCIPYNSMSHAILPSHSSSSMYHYQQRKLFGNSWDKLNPTWDHNSYYRNSKPVLLYSCNI
jgi:hypothetical protein